MKPARRRRPPIWAALISLAIIVGAAAFADYTWERLALTPSTDNASIDADVVHVAAAVGGRISAIPVEENSRVARLGGSVFAGVAVPVYDAGARAAQLEQARSEADAAAEHLERIRQDAVRQIVLADDALDTTLQSYSASEALVAAAQKTFDSALNSYRSGEGTVTDLNLAQTQLLQAKNASADSRSAALSAAATLAFATGALGQAPK
jgi:multidrug resistance efflux pump